MTSDKTNNQNKEYTAEQYKEDCRLVNFTYLKYFKGFPNYREDLIQSAFLNLCIYRDKFDSEKYNYSTFVVYYAYYGMLSFFRQKRKYDNNEDNFVSLDEPLKNDETTRFADLIVDDNSLDITAGFDLPYIKKCIANAIDYCCTAHYRPIESLSKNNRKTIVNRRKHKYNLRKKQIILEWLKLYNYTEVAKMFSISDQCVHIYCKEFKTALKNELIKTGYYE